MPLLYHFTDFLLLDTFRVLAPDENGRAKGTLACEFVLLWHLLYYYWASSIEKHNVGSLTVGKLNMKPNIINIKLFIFACAYSWGSESESKIRVRVFPTSSWLWGCWRSNHSRWKPPGYPYGEESFDSPRCPVSQYPLRCIPGSWCSHPRWSR